MKNLKRIGTLCLSLILALALAVPAFAAVDDTGYSDVDANAWYAEAVAYCREHDLMSGIGNHQFAPENSLTRAMLVTVLWRQAGSPAVNYLMQFSDVPEGRWYSEAIRWSASEGLILGYGDGRFGTNDNITQAHLNIILNKYTDRPVTENIPGFTGENIPVTRAQTAAVMWRLAQPQSAPTTGHDDFVRIDGGTFQMGSPVSEPERSSDEVLHSVTVSSFYMARTEVSQAEYQAVMGVIQATPRTTTCP